MRVVSFIVKSISSQPLCWVVFSDLRELSSVFGFGASNLSSSIKHLHKLGGGIEILLENLCIFSRNR